MESVIFQVSLVLLTAALGAWLAVQTYFRQREHELVLARYLEGSLDLLAAETSGVHETFAHNWARCLAILKSYRDLEGQFSLAELEKGFLPLQSSKNNIVAHHRLYTLVGDAIYWTYYQHAMAFYTSANSMLTKEIPEAVRVNLTSNLVSASHADVVEHAFKEAEKLEEKSRCFVALVSEFQNLSSALEQERPRLKSLGDFSSNRKVQESLDRVRSALKQLEDADANNAQHEHGSDALTRAPRT